jgi:hypothetical protein
MKRDAPRESIEQAVELRFVEVVLSAEIERLVPVPEHDLVAHQEDWDLARSRIVLQRAEELPAVETARVDIQQDQVGLFVRGHPNGTDSVGELSRCDPERSKGLAQLPLYRPIVIDDEHDRTPKHCAGHQMSCT